MFYPENGKEIERFIEKCNTLSPEPPTSLSQAIIVPHAGYIYSGYTANLAYRCCASPKRVVVIGPSHRVHLKGASSAPFDAYPTPCGELRIDSDFSMQLQQIFPWLANTPDAHHEHSTEVQMPLIAHYFPSALVVEIVYGGLAYDKLALLIDYCLNTPDTLVVISTDLSHFHSLEKAKTLDKSCINAIGSLNPNGFDNCEACGLVGIRAMVHAALTKKLSAHFLDYRTSYDHSGDASSVVGYTSFFFQKPHAF
jgi:AmmeMemoRadiSam system protein B